MQNQQAPSRAPSAEIKSLDPDKDFERIVFITHHQLFAVETRRALELALLKAFAAPSISALLEKTAEFAQQPSKRSDDTALMMCEITENGLSSDRAQRVIERLNAMHGRYQIAERDYLYVLSAFLFEPIDYIARYARRPLTDREQQAAFQHYHGLGVAMNLKGLPGTIDEFRRFRTAFERDDLRFAPSNKAVVDAALSHRLRRLRLALLRRIAKEALAGLVEPSHAVEALGLNRPRPWFVSAIRGVLKARGLLTSLLPEPRRIRRGGDTFKTIYPDGYEIEDLGVLNAPGKKAGGAG